MARRGWAAEQIDEAVQRGNRIDAKNRKTGGPATRYVNPDTGKSVVIDNTTDEVIQVGQEGFRHGPESGDVPGAVMRAPPSTENPTGSTSLPASTTHDASPAAPVEPAAPIEPMPIEPVEPIIPIEPLPRRLGKNAPKLRSKK
jgi:hypothetical protein